MWPKPEKLRGSVIELINTDKIDSKISLPPPDLELHCLVVVLLHLTLGRICVGYFARQALGHVEETETEKESKLRRKNERKADLEKQCNGQFMRQTEKEGGKE